MSSTNEITVWMTYTGKNALEVLDFYGGEWYIADRGEFGMVMRNDVIHNPYTMDPIPNGYILYKTKESGNRVKRMDPDKFHAKYPELKS